MIGLIKNLKLRRRGIAAMASMHLFGNPSAQLKIIGVTGTNGKTTVATLLYQIARKLGYRAGLISTVENLVNGEKMSATYNAPATTPDPIFLNRLLNEMVKAKCEYVFMEVTSHALDQDRVAGINFTGGIFTNLTHDHLDYHKNIDNYFSAKRKFFKLLPKNAFALSNVDDEYGLKMLDNVHARKFSYGFLGSEDIEFRGQISRMDFSGLYLKINGTEIRSKLLGKFNAYNLLAVWGACYLLGFDMHAVKMNFETILPPQGRFDYFTLPNGVMVVVDYAHSPDALEKILLAIREIKSKESRIISVFGCGGNRDPLKRPVMGKLGADLSDIAIFTSDNPREEDPEQIIEQMKTGLGEKELQKVMSIPSRHEAILQSVKLAQKGDIILCAGKGHEDYQEIKGVRYRFDDMEEYKKAYEQL